MASPTVADTNTSFLDTAGTSHTVNLPPNIAAGNLLLVFFAEMAPTATSTLTATDWTELTAFKTRDGTLQAIWCFYKVATGSEGATVDFTSSDNTKSAHTSYRITGAENPATQAPEAGTGVTGTTADADPPSVAGTGGSKDYLFITGLAVQGETFTPFTQPANYTNLLQANSGTAAATATNGIIGTAQRALTAASDDPGVWDSPASGSWVANTMLVHPAGTGTQGLTGTLFTKAPTFPQGAVTSVRNLTGTLFTKAPSFSTGTITSVRNLAGALFTKAPTFSTGSVTSTRNVAGVLYQNAPSFFVGEVATQGVTQDLTGTLFTKAPTFFTGGVIASQALAGTLFTKAPTFSQGAVTSGAAPLNGVLYQNTPLFSQGTISVGAVDLAGVLFTKAPTFFAGTVTAGAVSVDGQLYEHASLFFSGVVTQQGGPQLLGGDLFTKAPTFPQGSVNTGAVGLTGILFQKAPSFFQGNIGFGLVGVLFEKDPTFFVGDLIQEQMLEGVLYQNSPQFFQGSLSTGALEGVLFESAPLFFVGAITQGERIFPTWRTSEGEGWPVSTNPEWEVVS